MPRPRNNLAILILAAVLALVPAGAAAAQDRPENGRIAFGAKRDGQRVVYTRRSNGTGLRLLRTGTGADDPAFSVRGRRLLFTRRGALGTELWLMYLDGTGAASSPRGRRTGWASGRRTATRSCSRAATAASATSTACGPTARG